MRSASYFTSLPPPPLPPSLPPSLVLTIARYRRSIHPQTGGRFLNGWKYVWYNGVPLDSFRTYRRRRPSARFSREELALLLRSDYAKLTRKVIGSTSLRLQYRQQLSAALTRLCSRRRELGMPERSRLSVRNKVIRIVDKRATTTTTSSSSSSSSSSSEAAAAAAATAATSSRLTDDVAYNVNFDFNDDDFDEDDFAADDEDDDEDTDDGGGGDDCSDEEMDVDGVDSSTVKGKGKEDKREEIKLRLQDRKEAARVPSVQGLEKGSSSSSSSSSSSLSSSSSSSSMSSFTVAAGAVSDPTLPSHSHPRELIQLRLQDRKKAARVQEQQQQQQQQQQRQQRQKQRELEEEDAERLAKAKRENIARRSQEENLQAQEQQALDRATAQAQQQQQGEEGEAEDYETGDLIYEAPVDI